MKNGLCLLLLLLTLCFAPMHNAYAAAYEGDAGEIGDVTGATENAYEQHVLDIADVLTDAQEQKLNALAVSYSSQYDCGFYIAVVYDYRYYSTYSVLDAAAEIYEVNGFGFGQTEDGVMLMLSMDERDYALIGSMVK